MTPLLMTKVKNILKEDFLEFHLSNISINGSKRGCCGFVKNVINDKIIYINTEQMLNGGYIPLNGKILYRTAQSLKDYSGGLNKYCCISELKNRVLELLK